MTVMLHLSHAARLSIFIRDVNKLILYKEFAPLSRLHGPTTGEYLFMRTRETPSSLKLIWEISESVTTDGVQNMVVAKQMLLLALPMK
jgi:hypothetical protein